MRKKVLCFLQDIISTSNMPNVARYVVAGHAKKEIGSMSHPTHGLFVLNIRRIWLSLNMSGL